MAKKVNFDNIVILSPDFGKYRITKNADGTYTITDDWRLFNKNVSSNATAEDILDLINNHYSCVCSVVDGKEVKIKDYTGGPNSPEPVTMAEFISNVESKEQEKGISGEDSVLETYCITGDEATDKLALEALKNENSGKDEHALEDMLNNSVNKGDKYSIASDGSLVVEKDEAGGVKSKTTYDSNGVKLHNEKTSVDSSGVTKVEKSEYDPGETKPKKKTTTETKDGKTIQETTEEYDYPNNETTTTTVKYNADNSITETKAVIVDDGTTKKAKSITQTEKKYDEETKTKIIDTYNVNPEETTKILDFNRTTYDENDNIQSKVTIQYDSDTQKPTTREEISYDENGNEKTKTSIEYNGDKATVTIAERQVDGSIKTTKYECDVDSTNGEALFETAKQVGEPEVTTPATGTTETGTQATETQQEVPETDEELVAALTTEEQTQLETEIEAYMKNNNCTKEEATEACLKALRAKKDPKTNLSKYDGRDVKHPKLDEYINPKPFMTDKLTTIKDLLCTNSKENAKKAKAFREYLQTTLAKGPLFNQALTQLTGASREAYDRLLESLNIKIDTLTDNAKLAEAALKIIDEELVPALLTLAAIDEKRKELGDKLATKQEEYNEILGRKPERETIDVEKTDTSTEPPKTTTTTIPNPEYVSWLREKEEKEEEIDHILNEEPITIGEGNNAISVNGLVALNSAGEKVKQKCETILGNEVDLEALIKDFNDSYKDGKGKGSGNGRDPGGDPTGGGGNPPTEPLPELPDNTQEQMKYYKELSIADLSDIAENLAKFAETNHLTLQELLFDEKNAEKLVEYLGTLGVLNEDLRKLIKEGNTAKTQSLLKNIFTGKEATVVGLDKLTKEVVMNKVSEIAEANNISIANLLSESNASILRAGIQDKDVVSNLKAISAENMKAQISGIYDGDGVDNYSSKSLKTLRDYLDKASESNNMTIDEYLGSDASVKNIENLGKTEVLLNIISGFDDKALIETLQTLII